MVTVMAQTARFEFRVRPEDKARIEAAAAITHESASDFARAAAMERAEAVLHRQEVTLVPSDFFDALMDSLERPVVRNQRLSAAANRARELLREE
jgi:uncharacterized protein (DUF1778 family)